MFSVIEYNLKKGYDNTVHDDCDYEREVIGSGCKYDYKKGGHSFVLANDETFYYNGIKYMKNRPEPKNPKI